MSLEERVEKLEKKLFGEAQEGEALYQWLKEKDHG